MPNTATQPVQSPNREQIPTTFIFQLQKNEKNRHLPDKLRGYIILHTPDFRTTIQNTFQLTDDHILSNSSAIYHSVKLGGDDLDKDAAKYHNLHWKRTWQIKDEAEGWSGEIRRYSWGQDEDLCHLDVLDWLPTVCVMEVTGYRQIDPEGKIYRVIAGWVRGYRNCERLVPDYCLVSGVERPFVRWWSWKVKGRVYTGEVELSG
ncbi:hypothetical protein B0T21DRAFT_414443 [Apiosordaria backusii]|uniref:Uncharacterized protein n=1 Tax=Apiosordaria backusii TaxID=314023 RepID=A0AA40ASL7_9PEZI|nr:hypothetical protein B0T21DRAFT_414443 [Apiosordaria backusii]